jgi:hypothetical protein
VVPYASLRPPLTSTLGDINMRMKERLRFKHLVYVSCALVSLLLAGCMTESLLRNRPYTEEVSSVLVTSDKQKIVFMGKDYHYVFEAPPLLTSSLQSSFYPSLRAVISDFHVDKAGQTTGSLTLILSVITPQEQKKSAAAVGYKCRTMVGRGEFCEGEVSLRGVRYSSGGMPIGNQHRLNETYRVGVTTEDGPGAKVLLTPITLVGDGVLVLAGAPLMALQVGALLAICSGKNSCK